MRIRKPIPKAEGLDNTLALIKEGFHFIPSRREKLASDIFETRLIGRKAVCMAGEEAAAIFYDNNLFKRAGAAPKPLKQGLLGVGGIHGRDGEDHHQQKRMFLSMMTPERLEDMRRIAVEELDRKAAAWQKEDSVAMLPEMEEIMGLAGMRWAGLPLGSEQEAKRRAKELADMVDSFGGSFSRYQEGKRARESHEEWLRNIIRDIRQEKYNPPPYTAAYIVAHHRGADGKLLDLETAAVDLNNSYRPLVATAYFIVFGMLAMYEHPETVAKIRSNEGNYSHMFSQEIRRYYPFAPAMVAKAKKDFIWHGYHFKKDQTVVLDLFGTNRHPDNWEEADRFIPERFHNWSGSPFAFVPQGGGDHYMGHRCAGEWMTVIVMQAFFHYLTAGVAYDVPEQDLTYDLRRMPTMPKSGFVIRNVRRSGNYPLDALMEDQNHTAVKF
ncbi:cytochrome P450 [Indiicoccus explosivorum]|uniref:cytochrome P450 n=1 Tax=Indiicoccus explosivorum TaxID=1917864 RepID=UPI000B447926|nr:cytochrome P450 [Indiicoccus explosivorum]